MESRLQDTLRLAAICQGCTDRAGNDCGATGRTCLDHAAAEDCPRGKFVRSPTVSIIITVGPGLGRYLPSALESCRDQADQVIVVFDSEPVTPLDRTRHVVQIAEGNWKSVQQARRAGMRLATGEAVLFLDADNRLTPRFVERAARQLQSASLRDPRVAGIYPDLQYWDQTFSQQLGRLNPPVWDRLRFECSNYIDASCLVWKAVLDCCWRTESSHERLEDWATWEELARNGWIFERGDDLVLDYRKRPGSMSAVEHSKEYAVRYSLDRQRVTLFIPLHRERYWGRLWTWLKSAPVDTTIVIAETGGNRPLYELIRRNLSTSRFEDVRVYRHLAGVPGLADSDRFETEHHVQLAVGAIYNRFAQECRTPLALILEDDVLPDLPPEPLIAELKRGLDESTVAVTGLYQSRYTRDLVAWKGGSGRELQFLSDWRMWLALDQVDGVPAVRFLPVAGSGFGCLLVRTEALRAAPHAIDDRNPWYDPRFFEQLRRLGYGVKAAREVRCTHGDAPFGEMPEYQR